MAFESRNKKPWAGFRGQTSVAAEWNMRPKVKEVCDATRFHQSHVCFTISKWMINLLWCDSMLVHIEKLQEFVIVLHDKPFFPFIERSGLRLIKPRSATRDLQRNLPEERKRPRPGPLCTGGYYGGSRPTGHNRRAVSSWGLEVGKPWVAQDCLGQTPHQCPTLPEWGRPELSPRVRSTGPDQQQQCPVSGDSPCHSWLPATPPCSRQPLCYCSCFCWDVSGLEIPFWTWLFIPCIKSMRYRKLSLEVTDGLGRPSEPLAAGRGWQCWNVGGR